MNMYASLDRVLLPSKPSYNLCGNSWLKTNIKCSHRQFSSSLPLEHKRRLTSLQKKRAKDSVSCDALSSLDFSDSEVSLSLGDVKELSEVERFALSIPSSLRAIVGAALVIGAAGVGYTVGGKVHEDIGPVAGAVVLGAAGAGAATVLSNAGKEGSAKGVFNTLVTHNNPSALDNSEVTAASEKFGLALDDERLVEELREIYDRYVSGVLPLTSGSLKGHEVDAISQFKNALLLDDTEAAQVHIEIGRRMVRQRLEAGSKESSVAERKSFQQLVYVSNLVFGEKSKFLLPWKRVFKVTDSQVEIAILENAKKLLETAVEESNADADLDKLLQLRKLQLKFRVSDEVAETLVHEKSRARLESVLDEAIEAIKSRIKNIPKSLSLLEEAVNYSLSLGALRKESDIIPGVTAVTVAGGKYDGNREKGDLKLLYGTFLEDSMSGGRLEDAKVELLGKLRNLFGLGIAEAEAVQVEVTSKVYRRLLGQSVKSGALEAAESKAEFLEELCDNLQLDPEEAFKIHEDIYRQKLETCLKDNVLDDEDVKGLQRLTVLLCIPSSVVETTHGEICGRIFSKVVDDVVGSGVGGYDPLLQDEIKKAVVGLKLPLKAALNVVSERVKGIFLTYAKRARGLSDRVECGRELKKLIMFSNLTVSQLLDDVRIASGVPPLPSPSPPKQVKEVVKDEKELAKEERIARMEKIYEEESGMKQSFRKSSAQKQVVKEGKPQREITLKDDLELRDRQDLYERFLLYAVQGEEVEVSYGLKIAVQRDEKDLVRLQNFGEILGLQPFEIAVVQQRLSEKAFKSQAESLLADGQLNQRRAEQLKAIQKQVGLGDEAAQKIIKTITSGKMAGAIAKAVQQGQFSLEDVRGLKEAGLNIESMVAKSARVQMYKKLVAKELTAGTGDFNAELVQVTIPEDLALPLEEAKSLLTDAANERVKDSLVQAVSMLRQKQPEKVLVHVNNLITSDKASPQEEAVKWAVKEELLDLYGLYVSQAPADEEKESRLRSLLDIDENTADGLKAMAEKGGFSVDNKEEDFVF